MTESIGYLGYMRVRTKPQKRDEFVRLITKLRRDALENEPGTIVFEVVQGADLNEFVLIEGFVDKAAQKIHQNAPYHVGMADAGWACLEGTPIIEWMTPVAGPT